MKKLRINILLILSIILLCTTGAVADEEWIFGPYWAIKGKGKAVEKKRLFHCLTLPLMQGKWGQVYG